MESACFILGYCLMLSIPTDRLVVQPDQENSYIDSIDNDGDGFFDFNFEGL